MRHEAGKTHRSRPFRFAFGSFRSLPLDDLDDFFDFDFLGVALSSSSSASSESSAADAMGRGLPLGPTAAAAPGAPELPHMAELTAWIRTAQTSRPTTSVDGEGMWWNPSP